MKKYSDIMIDLETLDTENTSAILSIGAVCFDPITLEIGPSFYRAVDSEDQLKKGRTFSKSTVEWWQKQSNEAKKVFTDPNKVSMEQALDELSNFIKLNTTKVHPWGNGSMFDIGILEDMFKKTNRKVPWLFYNVMDLRTFKRFVANNASINDTVSRATYHNALDDALVQAKYVLNFLKERNK